MDVSRILSLQELLTLFENHPSHRHEATGTQRAKATQLFKFAHEVELGDYVLTPLTASETVLIGQVTGDYQFDENLFGLDHPHTRKVGWLRKVAKLDFSLGARRLMSTPPTLVPFDKYEQEVGRLVTSL